MATAIVTTTTAIITSEQQNNRFTFISTSSKQSKYIIKETQSCILITHIMYRFKMLRNIKKLKLKCHDLAVYLVHCFTMEIMSHCSKTVQDAGIKVLRDWELFYNGEGLMATEQLNMQVFEYYETGKSM